MSLHKLIADKDKQFAQKGWINFSPAQMISLDSGQIQHTIDYFHGYTLMRLPEEEIAFFEWLKSADPEVWQDLWKSGGEPYLVSIDFLHHLAGKKGSFPICDLIDQANYWFSVKHIKPKGNEALAEIINQVELGNRLDSEQEFLLQLSTEDQDIWHFCYRYKFSIDKMKKSIENMEYKGWLVHLPDRADLVKYIEI